MKETLLAVLAIILVRGVGVGLWLRWRNHRTERWLEQRRFEAEVERRARPL